MTQIEYDEFFQELPVKKYYEIKRESNKELSSKHHKLLGKVQPIDDKKKYKDAIITELYNSGILQQKITGMMLRNNIHQYAKLNEDFLQETFYYLCRTSADDIIEMYEDKKKKGRLIGLAVTIAVLKCFTKNKSGYPKHSLMTYLLFTSNINHKQCDEDDKNEMDRLIHEDNTIEEADMKQMYSLIFETLDEEETMWLDTFLTSGGKGSGKLERKVDKEMLQRILNKVR